MKSSHKGSKDVSLERDTMVQEEEMTSSPHFQRKKEEDYGTVKQDVKSETLDEEALPLSLSATSWIPTTVSL